MKDTNKVDVPINSRCLPYIQAVKNYLLALQNKICNALETIDDKQHFLEDKWSKPARGHGDTRIMTAGNVFEKAGINFSHVWGENLPTAATEQRPNLHGYSYNALGISCVMHPDNPYVPTAHANLRFFIAEDKIAHSDANLIWWFGGGFDLTPYYGFREDCKHWHEVARAACLPFGKDIYPKFKAWCDQYFYLKHRQEARGIGGLFFDDLTEGGFENSFALVKSIGDHFLPAYIPLVNKRKELVYGAQEKAFQLYRRGRYVEFNLIYDRGTLFGLQSEGRTESILISLPPQVSWQYNWAPDSKTPEAKLYNDFLPAQDWLD